MDLEITNKSVSVCNKVFDKKSEYPIDCEFTLPDYCPDIERILKCSIEPRVSNLSVMTDTAQVEINASICVLYVTNEDKLFGYEMPVSLSKTINTGSLQGEAIKQYFAKTEYVNCRAINNRKIDVHGSVSVLLKLLVKEDKDYISNINDESVVLKKFNSSVMEVCGFADKQVNVSDDIVLSSSSGSISNIIRYDSRAVVEEVKTISNKAIVKVNVMFEILYLSSDLRYETLKHTIPINQIIDVDGIDEDSVCNFKTDVSSVNLKTITNDEGEMRSIGASAKINLSVIAYNNNNISVVTDGYSTKYESQLDRKNLELNRFINNINENFNVTENLDVSSKISQIIDFKCIPLNYNCKTENDSTILCGDIAVGLSMIDDSGCCKYYEKVIPFEYKLKIDSQKDNCACDLTINVVDCSYNISSSDSIEIKCELNICGIITENSVCSIVSDLKVDETKAKQFDDMPSLVVYYGTKGESIWEIALKYNTSVEKIAEANKIDGETLQQNLMLLIPSI